MKKHLFLRYLSCCDLLHHNGIFTNMISVEEATQIILENALQLGHESITIHNALGRVLSQNILADTDLPPFDRVMMDGIAISSGNFMEGNREFSITDMQRAGDVQQVLHDGNGCIEIMTGAVLPTKADAVIPYEQIEIKDGIASTNISEIKKFQNIHRQGSDKRRGDTLVEINTRIGAAEIGIAASVGMDTISVLKLPRVSIFSTGDELVEINCQPKPHQIRRSNVYALQQLLLTKGIPSNQTHINDDYNEIKDALKTALDVNEIVILTGGVSKGKYDLLPQVLADCGVQKLFHQVQQRPGKPMWFGRKENTVVFAFPGNPVSTFMCAIRYLIPFLRKSFNQVPMEDIYLKLDSAFEPHPKLTFFAQANMRFDLTGIVWATPVARNGSGDFSSLTNGELFIEIPPGNSPYPAGFVVKAFPYKNMK